MDNQSRTDQPLEYIPEEYHREDQAPIKQWENVAIYALAVTFAGIGLAIAAAVGYGLFSLIDWVAGK